VIKLLSSLLALIERLFDYFDRERWKQQGRQEAVKEAEDAVQRQIEQGEAAVAVPDPVRDERLRDRFDRARQ
jgi:trimethylamine:corrinoid methyltransferase-like protein